MDLAFALDGQLQPRPPKLRRMLPYISAFHRLQHCLTGGSSLGPSERQVLEMLEDLFEPQCVTTHGVARLPVQFTVYREARVTAAHESFPGRVCLLTVWNAKVLVSSRSGLAVADGVQLDIENLAGDRWFSFLGRVTAFDATLGCATIELGEPLASDLSQPGCPLVLE